MPDTAFNPVPLLHALERPAQIGVDAPWLLVLMHGVGSNEQDLFSLAPWVPGQFHVLSLRAPHPIGPGSHAWFAFSVAPDGSRRIDEAQEAASREATVATVAAAQARLGVPSERTVLGGFSQGGIMAMSLLLTRPDVLHASLALHSRLLPELRSRWASPGALAGRPAWVSHGLQDLVIPLAQAHATREAFVALGLNLSYAEFPGGHEIRPAELQAVMAWLDGLTTN